MKAFVSVAVLTAAIPALSLAQVQPPAPGKDSTEIIKEMGPLADSLVAAFSMDDAPNGSEVFSRPPAPANAAFFNARFVKEGGRQCASFAGQRAGLTVFGVVTLGTKYSLTTWAKLPFAGDGATVWDGKQGSPLFVQGDQFKCSGGGTDYSLGEYKKALTGWHHLAITCDGNTTSLYIDGMINGTAPVAIEGSFRRIGSRAIPDKDSSSQCDLLDDMFVFNRALAPDELGMVAGVQLPVHAPAADGLAGRPSGATNAAFLNPTSIPSNPVSPAAVTNATELVRTYSNSLVFVTGSNGSGSGFIADMGGKPFLVTNAHVAAGVRGATFKTLQGTAVAVGSASVAAGHDIFVMQAKTVDTPLAIMRDVGEKAAIGDEVVVLGNAEGGGVINTIMGRIVGIGPDRIEIDAPFQPGNSGSPIIHLKSGKVIGVATYLIVRKYDTATREAIKEPVVRRFGYRIDSVKTWQPVDWKSFYAQAAELESIETLTKDFIELIRDIADDSKVNRSKHNNPVIKNRIDAWLSGKNKHMSVQDASNADQNFISFLKIASQTDVTAARQHLTYDYFQRQLVDQQSERSEISGIFGKIIASVRQ